MITRIKKWVSSDSEKKKKDDDEGNEGEEASGAADADNNDSDASDDDDDDEHEKPIVVNLDDFAAVKRALDDAVVEAVLDRGYAEDGRLFGTKLGLGLSACTVALVAQFYPGKPPATTPVLAACIVAYIVLTAAAAAFSMIAEGDAFLVTRQPLPLSEKAAATASKEEEEEEEEDKSAKKSSKSSERSALLPQDNLHLPSLRVSSNMTRFETEYELVVKAKNKEEDNNNNSRSRSSSSRRKSTTKMDAAAVVFEARAQLNATSFFRSDGTLEVSALREEVGKLLDEVEEKAGCVTAAAASGKARGGGGRGTTAIRAAAQRQSPRTKKN